MALITVQNLKKLQSRIVREKLKKKEPGNGSNPLIPGWLAPYVQKIGSVLSGGAMRLAGWAFSGLANLVGGIFVSGWETLVRATIALFTFDFNEESIQLKARIDQNNQSIANSVARGLGEFVGFGLIQLGTMAIGGMVGRAGSGAAKLIGQIKIPVLSSRIGTELAGENNAQLRANLRNTLELTGEAVAENLMIATTLAFRGKEAAKKAGATEAHIDGSLAARFDRKFLKPLPKFWQEVTRSFLGGVGSGVVQGGYVLARNFDDAVAESAWAKRQSTEQWTVELYPGANSPNPVERAAAEGQPPLVISGTREEIMDAVPTSLALHEASQAAGDTSPRDLFLKPGANRPQLVMVYQRRGTRSRHQFVIPHYNGAAKPPMPTFKTGVWHGYQVLSDGSKLACYGASKADALNTIKAFAKGVKPTLKTGSKPQAKESTANIKVGELIPVYADYYPQGKAGPKKWRHYAS
jgi:hypothetical protein